MDVFRLRNQLIDDYASFISSFIEIRDPRIREQVRDEVAQGLLWPDPLIQLNPGFEPASTIDELVNANVLDARCREIFLRDKTPTSSGEPLRLHRHQDDAIRVALQCVSYILTTGTGSGKSLAYIIPIVNHVLHRGSGKGIQAIIVYPMNALVNSQINELTRFLNYGFPDGRCPVTFARYTGQEDDDERRRIMADPPDILLTNSVMLELILTRPQERQRLIRAARGLQFLVLDELHTYRGRQGADVAMLVRRVREATEASALQCVGTSATLAGSGTYEEKQAEVARVASQLFGTEVKPTHVIGETVQRVTRPLDIENPDFLAALRTRIEEPSLVPPRDFTTFTDDPLAIWIETTFGVRQEPGSGRLVRAEAKAITGDEGAARLLSQHTSVSPERCREVLEQSLLSGYLIANPDTGFPAFAFRLHQFISRGESIYASIEAEDIRHITAQKQQYVPGSRDRILIPLVFCRECGQEYYSIYLQKDPETGSRWVLPRDLFETQDRENAQPGYLYASTDSPWPEALDAVLARVPDDWLEEHQGSLRIARSRRDDIPTGIVLRADGHQAESGAQAHFVRSPFHFCLRCGVTYGMRQTSDFQKLATLGTGGRSTATTILSLSTIRSLRQDGTLPKHAQKLLSFTDNRQDAALQAGHFNDFIQVAILRSALYAAVMQAGEQGISHEELAQRVFAQLNLVRSLYAVNPDAIGLAKEETDRALREILAYRLYTDLERGWRVTSPNLEQCGLLRISFKYLNEICEAEDKWADLHPALATADPDARARVASVLLGHMRRELAIKVDHLDPLYQEQIRQRSSQRLISPWALDDNEDMTRSAIMYPRPFSQGQDSRGNLFVSARGGFGQYLRRRTTFPRLSAKPTTDDSLQIIRDLLKILKLGGLVEIVDDSADDPGYQLPAAALLWQAGDGTTGYHDPIRVPNPPEVGLRTNPFFVEFYRAVGATLQDISSAEHTAQVDYEDRIERERLFGDGTLPVLYCSPTMELGVDIKDLNAVNLRNAPPTPANYAQRSGRAGRSGHPALVFTYCAAGSSHDQYFFKRPVRMVSGAVTPPRLDMSNEDLIRAHVQAIWLAETGIDLGASLKDVLNLSGDVPSLELQEHVLDGIHSDGARQRARARAERVLATLSAEVAQARWYTNGWLDRTLTHAPQRFDETCARWRGLYRAALHQYQVQTTIIADASRSSREKNIAKSHRREAESQLELLTEAKNVVQSDFYSYRYFASEGFLPGYNFPRLPLSAFIPGRRRRGTQDEYISRPRFLAISEFGPRALIYHEGARYEIRKVILPMEGEGEQAPVRAAKQCRVCGYLHPIREGEGPDRCQHCDAELPPSLNNLFRLQNVSTIRRGRINCDEEERLRMGFELRSGVRFAEYAGERSCQTAAVECDGSLLATLTYGNAATIWRLNMGWRRRRNPNMLGFMLDMEKGTWERSQQTPESDAVDDEVGPVKKRVIPYVEDHRNCLLIEPASSLLNPDERTRRMQMASLQSALKHAIQVVFQLEESELITEPLPNDLERRIILFYEASEGGAGVLHRLQEEPHNLALVAREALSICHFDPDTGEDLKHAPRAREECEAACYDCLMSYTNQLDHLLLDRKAILDLLQDLAAAVVRASPTNVHREEHLQRLMNLAGSDLERDWLRLLEAGDRRLPTDAQRLLVEYGTRPDFYYADPFALIYIDGPHHDYPERQTRDREQTERVARDLGCTILRFGYRDDWQAILDKHPEVFGGTPS